jgi:nucleotide-binding universal stress UspA family protein
MISIQGILVPVDFSKESILAAKFAVSLAQEYKTKLYLLHVRETIPGYVKAEITDMQALEQRIASEEKEALSNVIPQKVKDRISVEEISMAGSPVHHLIVEKAKELGADLIVLATHGRTGLAHVLLGSVAEHVVRHAPCPVFVIRNPKDKYVYDWE